MSKECTTCHHACECREVLFGEMLEALKDCAETLREQIGAIHEIYGHSQHCDCYSFELAEQARNKTHGFDTLTRFESIIAKAEEKGEGA